MDVCGNGVCGVVFLDSELRSSDSELIKRSNIASRGLVDRPRNKQIRQGCEYLVDCNARGRDTRQCPASRDGLKVGWFPRRRLRGCGPLGPVHAMRRSLGPARWVSMGMGRVVRGPYVKRVYKAERANNCWYGRCPVLLGPRGLYPLSRDVPVSKHCHKIR